MKEGDNASTVWCLRCDAVASREHPDSSADVSFYECPACARHYAQRPGGSLTYRWGHPITWALYCVIFDRDPIGHGARAAGNLLRGRTQEDADSMAEEIELELAHPTQRVSEMHDCRATEEACRAFLAEVVCNLKTAKPQ